MNEAFEIVGWRVTRKSAVVWMAITVVAALALRLYRLDAQSVWYDEAFSLVLSRLSLKEITAKLVEDFVHPPLYQYLLHEWFDLAGFGTYQARLLSVLAGTAAVGLLYILGRQLFDRTTAVFAAVLLAVSQLAVQYSQESRAYALTLCLSIAAASLCLHAVRQRSLRWWSGFVAVAALLVYAHYYASITVACLFVYSFLEYRRGKFPLSWVVGGIAVLAAAGLPWLMSGVVPQALNSAKTLPPVQPSWFAASWVTIFRDMNLFHSGALNGPNHAPPRWSFPVGAILFALPALFALRPLLNRGTSHTKRALKLAVMLWITPHAILLAIAALGVQYDVRYVLFAMAPYYILVARGIRSFSPTWRFASLVCILLYSGAALGSLYSVPYKENYRDALAELAHSYRDGDICVFSPFGAVPLQWPIYQGDRPLKVVSPTAIDPEAILSSRVWLVTYERVSSLAALNNPVRETIERTHQLSANHRYFWVQLSLFVPRAVPAVPAER